MKKQLMIGLLASFASASAMAAGACAGTAGNGTAVPGATDGSLFVRVGFTPKCSANVLLDYTDGQTSLAVAGGSQKGKNIFIGNTAGGAVKKSTTVTECPATGCSAAEVSNGLTEAEALASAT